MLLRDPLKPPKSKVEDDPENPAEEEEVPEPTYTKKIMADYYQQKDNMLFRDQEEKELTYRENSYKFCYKVMREEDTDNAKIKRKIVKLKANIIHPLNDEQNLDVWRRGGMYENGSEFYLQKRKYIERDEADIDCIMHDITTVNEETGEETKQSKCVIGFYNDGKLIYFREERDFEQERRDEEQKERY